MRNTPNADNKPLRILLIEDNPGDVRLMEETLADIGSSQYTLADASRLSDGLRKLTESRYDVILLDLALPDCEGLETVVQTRACTQNIPIVVLTGSCDDRMGVQAVHAGAQDYLVKGAFDSSQVLRSMRFAIERNRQQEDVRAASIMDELTGLYNRRGYLMLAEQMRLTAGRIGRSMTVLFADMDGLKQLNDSYGHQAGDAALRDLAGVMQQTFRSSDILARLGGDEYAVAAFDSTRIYGDVLARRLWGSLEKRNRAHAASFPLQVSIGCARYEPDHPCSLESLIELADHRMYSNKRERKSGSREALRIA